ncbi:MAG TPA: hypothetical protein VK072_04415 [Candidatus Avamphibacillus sp.]|nr:hypothetical protein [Candidatus Avamphibacillus sp.]
MKRILNCTASDFKQMEKQDLLQSIHASEGRTLLSEVICTSSPLYPELTNAEYVAAILVMQVCMVLQFLKIL